MEEISIARWEEFLSELNRIRELCNSSTDYVQGSPLLFRGQADSNWSLCSTLERVRERMLFRDYYRLIAKIKPQIESLTKQSWEIPDYPEFEQLVSSYKFNYRLWSGNTPAYPYMAYLRHHGFPSPLLDWTRSPYVAGYFAFANANPKITERVSIFVLCDRNFKVFGNGMNVVYRLGPYVKTHRRHVLQQSEYTACLRFDTEWSFESYDTVFEDTHRQQAFCWKITLPATERDKVLALLDQHNLNAFSLFGSEEGLMSMFANREFQ